MKKPLLLLFLSIIIISCKKSEKLKNEITESKKIEKGAEETESNLDNDFKIVEFSEDSGFFENLSNTEGKGPSLTLSFKIKNNTPNKISKFEFKRFAKATFSNGEFEYFPTYMSDLKKDNDMERFNLKLSSVTILGKGEIWKPNEIRNVELVIGREYDSYFGDMFNFRKKQFNRTPEQFYFAFKYYAVSVDKEYENYQVFDVLPFWKNYQEDLGLR